MREVRQSTSTNDKIGPFLDDTNGKTAETALSISQSDIRLSKNGGDYAQQNSSGGASHDEAGWYGITLDATDTGTLGRLILQVHVTGALPVWVEYEVVTQNYWDSKYGTDKLQVDCVEIEGSDATDQINAACDTALTDYDAVVPADLSSLATAAALQTVDDNVDLILADTNELQTDDVPGLIAALNDPTVGEIADAVWDEDIVAAHNTADTAGALLDDLGTPANFKADVSTLAIEANVEGHVTSSLNTYDPPTNAELTAAVANVSVDEIQQSALADLFNTDSGTTYESAVEGSVVKEIADNAGGATLSLDDIADAVWDEDIVAAHNTADTAGALLDDLGTPANFKADVSALATAVALQTVDDNVDLILADTNELQTDDVPGLIAALNDPTVGEIADAVWDEDIVAAHNTADTAGALLDDLGTPASFKADVSALAIEANVEGHVTSSLNTYDPPTKGELDTAQAAIQSDIGALNDLSAAEVNAEVDTALTEYDAVVPADLATLATAAALQTVDDNVDAILLDTGTDGVLLATGAVDADALADTGGQFLADHILKRNMATARASSDGDGTGRMPIQALALLRNKRYPSGTQLVVTKEDDVTEDFRFDVTSDAEAEPVTAMDPTT